MNRARHSCKLKHLVAGCMFVVVSQTAIGATSIRPDIRAGVNYIDNAGATGGQDIDSAGLEIDASLRIASSNDRGELVFIPKIRATRRSEDRAAEAEEQRLQVNWLRLFRTATSRMRLGIERKDLLTSELRDFDLDLDGEIDIGEEGSGIVDVESTRTRLFFREEFLKWVNSRNALLIGLDYRDINFDEPQQTTRFDFRSGELTVGWGWQVGERSQIRLSASAERFESDDNVVADSLSSDLRFQYQLSETNSAFVAAGVEQSEVERNNVNFGTENNVTFAIGGERNLETRRYRINLSRYVRPTTAGNVREQTGISVQFEQKFSERFSVNAGLNAFRSESLGDFMSAEDRDALTAKLRFAWRINRTWSWELNLNHSRQDFESSAITPDDDERRSSVFLNIRYLGLNRAPVSAKRP